MRRRDFIGVLGSAAVTWPLAVHAQQSSARRVGVLSPLSPSAASSPSFEIFRKTLLNLGHVEGRSISLDYRWADGDPIRAQAHAKELIELSPDVFLVGGSTAMRALGPQTRTIPIVFANANDQVESGLVASLARLAVT